MSKKVEFGLQESDFRFSTVLGLQRSDFRFSTVLTENKGTEDTVETASEQHDYDIGQTETSCNNVQQVIDAAWESLD